MMKIMMDEQNENDNDDNNDAADICGNDVEMMMSVIIDVIVTVTMQTITLTEKTMTVAQ